MIIALSISFPLNFIIPVFAITSNLKLIISGQKFNLKLEGNFPSKQDFNALIFFHLKIITRDTLSLL